MSSPVVYHSILNVLHQLKDVISEQVERVFEDNGSRSIFKEQEQKAAVQQVTMELLLDTLDRQAKGQESTVQDLEQFVATKVRAMLTQYQSTQPKVDSEQQATAESSAAIAPVTTGEQVQDATAPAPQAQQATDAAVGKSLDIPDLDSASAPQAQEAAPAAVGDQVKAPMDSVVVQESAPAAQNLQAPAPVSSGEQVQAPTQETAPAAVGEQTHVPADSVVVQESAPAAQYQPAPAPIATGEQVQAPNQESAPAAAGEQTQVPADSVVVQESAPAAQHQQAPVVAQGQYAQTQAPTTAPAPQPAGAPVHTPHVAPASSAPAQYARYQHAQTQAPNHPAPAVAPVPPAPQPAGAPVYTPHVAPASSASAQYGRYQHAQTQAPNHPAPAGAPVPPAPQPAGAHGHPAAPAAAPAPAPAPAPARPTPSLAATEPQAMPVFSDYINQINALQPLPFADLYSSPIKPEERFSIGNKEKELPDLHLAKRIPSTGSTIVAKHSSTIFRVVLGNVLTQAPNSMIYQTDMPGVVAKIYHSEQLLKENAEKVKLLISKTTPCASICFPFAMLYNEKQELVGHLLPQAQGFNLASTVYIPANLRKNFISWTKADTVQLCISILERVDYLYKRNIFAVGLTPKDILVKSPTEVYFIGTEKYQIDGYPSSLYCFEDTEAKGSKWTPHSVFLSPQGSVRYSVAIILFQIMMLGKHPYTNTAGKLLDNIRNAAFAYMPNTALQGFVPAGPWLAMWSHLDSNIQQAFYETFHGTGKYHPDHMHLSCEAWLDLFKAYHRNLVNSALTQQDPLALDLLPAIAKA